MSRRLPNLVLTCSSKSTPRSSLESQLQKRYTIYALSRFLDVSYFHIPVQQHSGFSHVAHLPTVPLLANRHYELFHIPSDRGLPEGGIIYRFPSAELGTLCNIRDEAKRKSDSFHFIEITSAHEIVEKHPRMLHYIKEVSPFKPSCSLPLKIAIHVRHKDLLEPEKTLPNSFCLTVVERLIHQLSQRKLPFVCELHMEIISQKIAPYFKNFSLQGEGFNPLLASSHESFTKEFNILPNLKKFINHDPISSLQSLATADFLLMNHYSFSYLAALLNKKGLIIFPPFLKNPLPGWINATDSEMISQKIGNYQCLHRRR